MFESIDSRDVPTFVRKFRTESDNQCFHTYRELILGSKLCQRGLNLRYEQDVNSKTPDWVVLGKSGEVEEILDVVTLHQRRDKDLEIGQAISAGRAWAGWVTLPPNHIYSKIQSKAETYADLAARIHSPYTVCLFGEFTACLDPLQVEHVLYIHHGGLFTNLASLAGVLYFYERSGIYHYSHFTNQSATNPSRHISQLFPATGRALDHLG